MRFGPSLAKPLHSLRLHIFFSGRAECCCHPAVCAFAEFRISARLEFLFLALVNSLKVLQVFSARTLAVAGAVLDPSLPISLPRRSSCAACAPSQRTFWTRRAAWRAPCARSRCASGRVDDRCKQWCCATLLCCLQPSARCSTFLFFLVFLLQFGNIFLARILLTSCFSSCCSLCCILR